jgi:signal transduction histidine kinase
VDYITKFRRQLALRTYFAILLPLLIALGTWVALDNYLDLPETVMMIISAVVGLICTLISTSIIVSASTKPVEMMQDVIGFASHDNRNTQQPDINKLKLGRELITAQSLQIYDLASSAKTQVNNDSQSSELQSSTQSIIDIIATPIYGVDGNQIVTVVNNAGANYIGKAITEIVGKPLFDSLNLSFQSDETYKDWLETSKTNSVTGTRSWDRVRHIIDADNSKQFDLVASFSNGNNSGTESMLALFDKSDKYNNDDQDISFVALAVHELRTPLTIMRGYIEVFEDELGPTLNAEMTEFMHKMHASSQQLASFVNNILNVARIEENQLSLKLRSENWEEILKNAVEDLELRAQVHGIHIDLTIANNLPPVAADRISVHEVINNLVDNAVKYSGKSGKIVIESKLNSEGMIETSVQDFGIGIPDSVVGQLFQKFHRSHRSSGQVVGSGLGLYLCKALVTAHGGNIWVRSKEGEGSIFTFTLLPFDKISAEQAEGEDGIIRGAHGWIKNHSLYRN